MGKPILHTTKSKPKRTNLILNPFIFPDCSLPQRTVIISTPIFNLFTSFSFEDSPGDPDKVDS